MHERTPSRLTLSGRDVDRVFAAATWPIDYRRLVLANFPAAMLYVAYLDALIARSVDPSARLRVADFEIILRSITFRGPAPTLDHVESALLDVPGEDENGLHLGFHFAEPMQPGEKRTYIETSEIGDLVFGVLQRDETPWALEILGSLPRYLSAFFQDTLHLPDLVVSSADVEERYESVGYVFDASLPPVIEGLPTPEPGIAVPPAHDEKLFERIGRRLRSVADEEPPLPPRIDVHALVDAELLAFVRRATSQRTKRPRTAIVDAVVRGETFDYLVIDDATHAALGFLKGLVYADVINRPRPPLFEAEWTTLIQESAQELGVLGDEELAAAVRTGRPL